MVSATRVPNNSATLCSGPWVRRSSHVVDRSITPSAHRLASSGIGSARLQLSCSPCLADLYADGSASRGNFAGQHHLPGDARRFVGHRHGGQLGGLRLTSASQVDALPLRRALPDHGGCPDHQHAAQCLVPGARHHADRDLARGRMTFAIVRREARSRTACGLDLASGVLGRGLTGKRPAIPREAEEQHGAAVERPRDTGFARRGRVPE